MVLVRLQVKFQVRYQHKKSRFLYQRKPFCFLEKAVLSYRENRFLFKEKRCNKTKKYEMAS